MKPILSQQLEQELYSISNFACDTDEQQHRCVESIIPWVSEQDKTSSATDPVFDVLHLLLTPLGCLVCQHY